MSGKKEETVKVPSKGGDEAKEGAEEKERVQKQGEEKVPELVGGRAPPPPPRRVRAPTRPAPRLRNCRMRRTLR